MASKGRPSIRFTSLEITNFKAVRRLSISELRDVIVIAGPNGCGKTCIFDAIRLLKSVYGGYDPNEWQSWFGEFQIHLRSSKDLQRLFRDPHNPLHIGATVVLSESEIAYLDSNAETLIESIAWRQNNSNNQTRQIIGDQVIATELRRYGNNTVKRTAALAASLRSSLASPSHSIALTISTEYHISSQDCFALEVLFQTYDPQYLGVIDYHSVSRSYEREQVSAINLSIESQEVNRRQHSLYNWQNKYRNMKTELASHYIRDILARESGEYESTSNLNETLIDLFGTFFPGKEYQGPKPHSDGSVSFPITLSSGEIHDIDELSSGEKEIVYGYLRLRNSAPRNSMILLDEPELHLNPGLLRSLPDFYYRQLGVALGNQLWLVTHSDTILRQSVGNPGFSVYHMTTALSTPYDSNQALPISADTELEQALIELVGDLATYRPQAKIVILEGGGQSESDVQIVSRLFPEIAQSVNLVSGGSKNRVRGLYEAFLRTASQIGMDGQFFAIVDRDSDTATGLGGDAVLQWDRYHIENYLLEPDFLRSAVQAVMGKDIFRSTEDVVKALRECASKVISRIVVERLQRQVNNALISSINIGLSPVSMSPAVDIVASIESSSERFNVELVNFREPGYLTNVEVDIRNTLDNALLENKWIDEFPGRDILRCFVDSHLSGISYEAFRYLIVDKMVDVGFRPEGMREILDYIVEYRQIKAK